MRRAFHRFIFIIGLAPVLLIWDARAGETSTILVFGDSLVAGYNIAKQDAVPARMEAILRGKGHDVRVINAGISGDTTAGGVRRLVPALDKHQPDIVVLELGANDMLRGLNPANTRANLEWMLTVLRDRNIPTLLAGMKAPMNYGPEYANTFNRIYPELAEAFGAALYPFMLETVYGKAQFMLPDGLHPNALGADRIARDLAAALIPALKE